MRRCVAIDKHGKVVMMFGTMKEAADQMGLLPDRIRKAIVNRKIVADLMWMYEDDYIKAVGMGRVDFLAWGEKPKAKKKPKKRREPTMETRLKIAITKQRNEEYRRRSFRNVWASFSRLHVPWLMQLKDAWLERIKTEIPIRPDMLAEYYPDKRDKDVAMITSLLISRGKTCYDGVQMFRKIMGEHPWQWFKDRGFVDVAGLSYYNRRRIFLFFSEWWQECFKYAQDDSIEDCIKRICRRDGLSYCEMIERTSFFPGWNPSRLRYFELSLVCSRSDGLGTGLWEIARRDLCLPIVGPVLAFLRTWMPDASRYGSLDECKTLFGMDDVDFYYCEQAYSELTHFRPKECSRYASFYQAAYNHCTVDYDRCEWRSRQPQILFEPEVEVSGDLPFLTNANDGDGEFRDC